MHGTKMTVWMKLAGTPGINETLIHGQQLGVYDTYYHLANGFSLKLPYTISKHTDKDTFIAFTDVDDLMDFYVRNEEDKINQYLSGRVIDDEWVEKHVRDDIFELAKINMDRDLPDLTDPRKE